MSNAQLLDTIPLKKSEALKVTKHQHNKKERPISQELIKFEKHVPFSNLANVLTI